MKTNHPIERLWSIWKFSGVTVPQPDVIVARLAEPNDVSVQHEYQKVLGQVWAFDRGDALGKWANH